MASEEINQKILEALVSLEMQSCSLRSKHVSDLKLLANLKHSIMGTTEPTRDPRTVGIPKKKISVRRYRWGV